VNRARRATPETKCPTCHQYHAREWYWGTAAAAAGPSSQGPISRRGSLPGSTAFMGSPRPF